MSPAFKHSMSSRLSPTRLSLTKHISARFASQLRFSFPPPQGKPCCQRAEDPHVGVRGEVIEQEGKQETVSQRRGSHAALAMNRLA